MLLWIFFFSCFEVLLLHVAKCSSIAFSTMDDDHDDYGYDDDALDSSYYLVIFLSIDLSRCIHKVRDALFDFSVRCVCVCYFEKFRLPFNFIHISKHFSKISLDKITTEMIGTFWIFYIPNAVSFSHSFICFVGSRLQKFELKSAKKINDDANSSITNLLIYKYTRIQSMWNTCIFIIIITGHVIAWKLANQTGTFS